MEDNMRNILLGNFRLSIFQCMTRCGRGGCRCKKGLMHGPYWYARFTGESGRRRTVYLGSQLPKELAKLRDLFRDEGGYDSRDVK
jgi:hypothetical protein